MIVYILLRGEYSISMSLRTIGAIIRVLSARFRSQLERTRASNRAWFFSRGDKVTSTNNISGDEFLVEVCLAFEAQYGQSYPRGRNR